MLKWEWDTSIVLPKFLGTAGMCFSFARFVTNFPMSMRKFNFPSTSMEKQWKSNLRIFGIKGHLLDLE
jgi:hypothetical protein